MHGTIDCTIEGSEVSESILLWRFLNKGALILDLDTIG
jgi:hypothetical protein